MKLGSLFDGSGGFPLAGTMNGMTPVWASEIEPYPLRVTADRFPDMKQLGDVTKIDGAGIEPVDVITFGSPCQDLSVAGKQTGIHDGKRSSLFFEAVRIIREMRGATNGKHPRFAVWENVPGAFSSNKGADFCAVLQALCEIADTDAAVPEPPKGKWAKAGCVVGDGYSIAWRVYDAQYWGVPQRRKRIYLVADFGSERAGEILFEREGVRGDSAEGFRAWQRTAGNAADCAGTAGICLNDKGGQRMDVTDDVSATLRAEAHHPPCVMESEGFCAEHSSTSRSIGYEEECSPTLRAGVVPSTVYENHSQDTRYTGPVDTAPTVSATYGMGGNNQPFVVCVGNGQVHRADVYPDVTGALCANSHPGSYTGQDAFNDMLPVYQKDRRYIVRRLTPLECCRLQGFPDWWEDGANGSDSARYKMWGNGIALPCAADVMRRIAKEGACNT